MKKTQVYITMPFAQSMPRFRYIIASWHQHKGEYLNHAILHQASTGEWWCEGRRVYEKDLMDGVWQPFVPPTPSHNNSINKGQE